MSSERSWQETERCGRKGFWVGMLGGVQGSGVEKGRRSKEKVGLQEPGVSGCRGVLGSKSKGIPEHSGPGAAVINRSPVTIVAVTGRGDGAQGGVGGGGN